MSAYYSKALDYAQLILYCAFIYWLSNQSSLPAPQWFPYQDKLHHAGAYFILAGLTVRAFRHFIAKLNWLLFGSLLFSSLYGISDEWHQSFVNGRYSDVNDWLADTLGAALCLGLYGWYARHKQK